MNPILKQDMEDIYSRRTDWDNFDGKKCAVDWRIWDACFISCLFSLLPEKREKCQCRIDSRCAEQGQIL